MPNHRLCFKVGVSVMLLRNIDVASGLCNGTRLTVVSLGQNVITARVVNGSHSSEMAYIPCMNLIPSDSNAPIVFQRR